MNSQSPTVHSRDPGTTSQNVFWISSAQIRNATFQSESLKLPANELCETFQARQCGILAWLVLNLYLLQNGLADE